MITDDNVLYLPKWFFWLVLVLLIGGIAASCFHPLYGVYMLGMPAGFALRIAWELSYGKSLLILNYKKEERKTDV